MFRKISMANTPTPIEKIQFMEADLPVNLYFKRDDLSGLGLSGNKIRKLEYLLQKAIDDGVTDIITCGAIQSNHCRATALACAKLGISCRLLLAGDPKAIKEGNNFFDMLAGAEQRYISAQDYQEKRDQIMEDWKNEIQLQGDRQAMVIPMGASCGLGSFGYADCFSEIKGQEEELGIEFDAIVIGVGSGGSLAGLVYGNELEGQKKEILGISVAGSRQEVIDDMVNPILEEMRVMDFEDDYLGGQTFEVVDQYVGQGYGRYSMEEMEFIRDFVSQTGIILDPVYTGKAAFGLINEIINGRWEKGKNILFIHTGGAMGWTQRQMETFLSL